MFAGMRCASDVKPGLCPTKQAPQMSAWIHSVLRHSCCLVHIHWRYLLICFFFCIFALTPLQGTVLQRVKEVTEKQKPLVIRVMKAGS